MLHPVARNFLQKNPPQRRCLATELLVSKVPTNPTSSPTTSLKMGSTGTGKGSVAMERFEISQSTADSRVTADTVRRTCVRSGAQRDARPLHSRAAGPRCPEILKHMTLLEFRSATTRIQQRRPPIRIPMETHPARGDVAHRDMADHWCRMEIRRVILACLQVDIGGIIPNHLPN